MYENVHYFSKIEHFFFLLLLNLKAKCQINNKLYLLAQ